MELSSSSKKAKIVPGNRKDSKFEHGENFWWMDWTSSKFNKLTLYFKCDHLFQNIQLLFPAKIHSSGGYLDVDMQSLLNISDLRVMNNEDGQLYVYNPRNSIIAFKILKIDDPMIVFDNSVLTNGKSGSNYGFLKFNEEK
jgi:hypothetical protein